MAICCYRHFGFSSHLLLLLHYVAITKTEVCQLIGNRVKIGKNGGNIMLNTILIILSVSWPANEAIE